MTCCLCSCQGASIPQISALDTTVLVVTAGTLYAGNLRCMVAVQGVSGGVPALSFTMFSVEPTHDQVRLQNGMGPTAELIGSYSDDQLLDQVIVGPSGVLTVLFQSNSATNSAGFSARVLSLCPTGWYSDTGSSMMGPCTPCPLATLAPPGHALACTQPGVVAPFSPCPVGQYSPGGAPDCTLCPAGRYGHVAGLTDSSCSGVCGALPGHTGTCSPGSTSPGGDPIVYYLDSSSSGRYVLDAASQMCLWTSVCLGAQCTCRKHWYCGV